jgi:hypothetical protein
MGMLADWVRSMSSVEVFAGKRYVWPSSQGVCINLARKTRHRVRPTRNWFLR